MNYTRFTTAPEANAVHSLAKAHSASLKLKKASTIIIVLLASARIIPRQYRHWIVQIFIIGASIVTST